jgi:hypothetical protein
VPGPDFRPPEEPNEPDGGTNPGQVAAAIATGVLCLWEPFTLILALVLSSVPACAGSRAAICTRLGHLAGMWAPTAGGTLGLALVALGCWVFPRRHHGLFALAGLALAAAGLLVTVGLANSAPIA